MNSQFQLLRTANPGSGESAPTATNVAWFQPIVFPGAEGVQFNFTKVTETANVQIYTKQVIDGVDTVLEVLPAALAVQSNKVITVANPPTLGPYWCTFSALVASKACYVRHY
jgi:hypothetical protein